MEENEKREVKRKKIKFNLIDAFIITGLIACALYLWSLKVKLDGKNSDLSKVIVTYKVNLQDADENFSKLIKSGDIIQISSKEKDVAVVKNVEVSPFKKPVLDAQNGKFVMAESPDKLDIIVTLEGRALESDKEIKIGNAVISVGENALLKGRGYTIRSYITYVDLD